MSMWQLKRAETVPAPQAAQPSAQSEKPAAKPRTAAHADQMIDLKVRIHQKLIERLNLSLLEKLPREQVAGETAQVVSELLDSEGVALNRAERAHLIDTSAPDLGREQWAKSPPPEPHRLVADVDPALVQQVLDVPEREREPHVQHHGQADDLWAAVKALERIRFSHPRTLRSRPTWLKPEVSDRTMRDMMAPRKKVAAE